MVLNRILYTDGGFMLGGDEWRVVRPAGWMTFVKRRVFIRRVRTQRDQVVLYGDRDCTERLGLARRIGPL